MMEQQYQSLAEMIISGDEVGVKRLTAECLAAGATAREILSQGLLPGMDTVGQLFKEGEMFIPEVLMAARAMTGGMQILRPLLSESDVQGSGVIVLGTVQGDIHNIGKDLVGMLLEGAGFKVINLGVDIAPGAFVQAALDHKADIVAMSALLTTTMPRMKDTVDALREAGVRERVKVLIGGAPVNADYARTIGGDAYAPDAAHAVDMARALVAA